MFLEPFLGALFEGFVASELLKAQLARGRARELYYFRDQQGLEVDFVVPLGEKRMVLMEAKASRSVRPEAASSLLRLAGAMRGYDVTAFVVHRPAIDDPASRVLTRGVSAIAATIATNRITAAISKGYT